MYDEWLARELEQLAEICPSTGEDILKQIYQWRHDVSKAWASALLASAFAFIGTAALSVIKSELKAFSLATWILVAAGGAAILCGGFALRRLQALLPEFLFAIQVFGAHRRNIHGGPSL